MVMQLVAIDLITGTTLFLWFEFKVFVTNQATGITLHLVFC
jgi:hypothetical protein